MIPPDKELLRRVGSLLEGQRYEQLQDLLVEKLGDQQEGTLATNQLDIVTKLKLQRQGRLEPRTALLIGMHLVDEQIRCANQYERSLLLYNELLRRRLCEQPHLALYNIAIAEQSCGRIDAALHTYSRCIKAKPGFWPAVLNYSVLLGRAGRMEECWELLAHYLRYHPSRRGLELQWIAASNRSHYHEVMKRYRGRRLHYQVAFNLALYLKRIGHGIESIRLLRSVEHVAKDGKVATASTVLRGMIYQEHRRFEQAIEVYRTLANEQKGSALEMLQQRIRQLEDKAGHLCMPTGRIPLSPLNMQQSRHPHEQSLKSTIRTATLNDNVSELHQRKLRFLLDKEKKITQFFDKSHRDRSQPCHTNNEDFEREFQQSKERMLQEKRSAQIREVTNDYIGSLEKKLAPPQQRTKTTQPRVNRTPIRQVKNGSELNSQMQQQAPKQTQRSSRFDNTLGFTLTGFPNIGRQANTLVKALQTQGSATKQSEHASVSVLQPVQLDHSQDLPDSIVSAAVPEAQQTVVIQENAQKAHQRLRSSIEERSLEPPSEPQSSKPVRQGNGEHSLEIIEPGPSEPIPQIIHLTVPSSKNIKMTETGAPVSPTQKKNKEAESSAPAPKSSRGKQMRSPSTNRRQTRNKNNKDLTSPQSQAVQQPPPHPTSPRAQLKKGTVRFNNTKSQSPESKPAQAAPAIQPVQSPSKPRPSIRHLEECRSIRQIMDNPLYSASLANSPAEESSNLTQQVDELLLKETHEHALQIYKRQYKEAASAPSKADVLLKIAWVFEKWGCQQNARKTYEKCLKLGMNSQAFVRLGELQIRSGLTEEGIDNLEKATCMVRDDEQIKLKLAYGYSMLEVGLSKALAITNEILLKDSTNLRAIMLSSNIHQKMGNIDLALEISEAIDSNRNNESVKHYIGLLYLQKQEIQAAYGCFKDALRINPKYVPALVESASILSIDSPQAAVKVFEKALQIEPSNMSALTRLARLYETELNDNQRAIETYTKVLAISETYETYEHLGNCYYRCGKYKEAIEHFKLAITLDCSASAWKLIAECYEHLKQYDRALNYFQLALSLEPSEELHRRIGTCHIYLENFKAAIRSLKHAVELKDSAQCQSLIANCYYLLEQYDLAIEHYQKSLDSDDSNINTLYNMAICFDQKEQFLVSKTVYENVLQLDLTHTSSLYNLANIMLVLGKNAQSAGLFERAISHQPDNYERRLELIELYETMNDLNKAEQHLLHCHRQNDQDADVIDKLIRVYRKKKDIKKVNRFQKLLLGLKSNHFALRTKTQV